MSNFGKCIRLMLSAGIIAISVFRVSTIVSAQEQQPEERKSLEQIEADVLRVFEANRHLFVLGEALRDAKAAGKDINLEIPRLRTLIGPGSAPEMRMAAALALGVIGPSAKQAVPEMVEVAKLATSQEQAIWLTSAILDVGGIDEYFSSADVLEKSSNDYARVGALIIINRPNYPLSMSKLDFVIETLRSTKNAILWRQAQMTLSSAIMMDRAPTQDKSRLAEKLASLLYTVRGKQLTDCAFIIGQAQLENAPVIQTAYRTVLPEATDTGALVFLSEALKNNGSLEAGKALLEAYRRQSSSLNRLGLLIRMGTFAQKDPEIAAALTEAVATTTNCDEQDALIGALSDFPNDAIARLKTLWNTENNGQKDPVVLARLSEAVTNIKKEVERKQRNKQ